MALYFDPETGLTPDEIETVREQVRAAFVAAFTKAGQPNLNTEPETPAGQLIDSLTAAIVEKDNEILYLASMFDPLTAEGIWQDALGHIYFMERQRERASVASVTCTGLQGTIIAEGAIIRSTADDTEWSCIASATIPASGSVIAEFACSEAGPVDAAPGTLTKIITVTPGWESADNIASQSVATCVCTGTPGTLIPVGTGIKRNGSAEVWQASQPITIGNNGTSEGTFICQSPTEAAANRLTVIVNAVSGWTSVTNPEPARVVADVVLGELVESQISFEHRRAASVAKNARGSLAAIYGSLADIPGVIDLVVLENTTSVDVVQHGVTIPGHSIYASIKGGTDSAIAEAIYRHKDAGCGTAGNHGVTFTDNTIPGSPSYSYQIQRPSDLPIYIRVILSGATISPDVESSVKDAVIKDFNGQAENIRAGMAQTLYASRFYCPVREIAGQDDIVSIRIGKAASPTGLSVDIPANRYPVIDESYISVEAAGE